jgi:hypothetical protein
MTRMLKIVRFRPAPSMPTLLNASGAADYEDPVNQHKCV